MSILIKIDVDGVLRDWNRSLIRAYVEHYPNKWYKFPFENFDIAPYFEIGTSIRDFYSNVAYDDIYLNAQPYPGAIQFVEKVLHCFDNVWLVSTQFKNTMFPTMQWIEKTIPSATSLPLIFSKEKGEIGKSKFSTRVLVDDAPHNLDSELKHGGIAIPCPHPYNVAWRKKHYFNTAVGEPTEEIFDNLFSQLIAVQDFDDVFINY